MWWACQRSCLPLAPVTSSYVSVPLQRDSPSRAPVVTAVPSYGTASMRRPAQTPRPMRPIPERRPPATTATMPSTCEPPLIDRRLHATTATTPSSPSPPPLRVLRDSLDVRGSGDAYHEPSTSSAAAAVCQTTHWPEHGTHPSKQAPTMSRFYMPLITAATELRGIAVGRADYETWGYPNEWEQWVPQWMHWATAIADSHANLEAHWRNQGNHTNGYYYLKAPQQEAIIDSIPDEHTRTEIMVVGNALNAFCPEYDPGTPPRPEMYDALWSAIADTMRGS